MHAKYAAITGLLSAAFLAAASGPRPALYEGLEFSKAVCDREGRFLRLLPAADGRYRLWLSLGEFSPLLVAAARIEFGQRGRSPETAVSEALARRSLEAADPAGESFWRRARLALAAWRLRTLYGPDELLEGYLNLAPYGKDIDGAAAASLIYFGKNPDQLNLTEALELSVIPDHPIRATLTGPDNPSDRAGRSKARQRLRERWKEPQRPRSIGAVAAAMPAAKVTDKTNALQILMGKE
ncbi:MAG: transglycosylase domain-containing protein [Elusimicrobia bacterium]|nr:transglycosylase domain-containing protein [Elusimicrobiota bacterium]